MEDTGRLFWLDAIRIVATFGVVLLHVAAPSLYRFEGTGSGDWHIANVIDSLTRPSVPLFFMVSGALLLRRSVEVSQLKPRLARLVMPLVAWSVLYLAIQAATDPGFDVIGVAVRAPIAPVMYHLWFLYALIGLYLCLPLVGPVVRAARPAQLRYGLVLWILASGIIPTLEWVLRAESSFELSTMAGYMGYMVMGYALAQMPRPGGRQMLIAVFLIAAGYSVTVFGTAAFSVDEGRFFGGFYGYFSLNVVLYSVGVFVLMRALFEGRRGDWAMALSDLSFGIYLVHVAVLIVGGIFFDVRGWWIIPFAVLAYAVSALIALVLRRAGLGKFLAP